MITRMNQLEAQASKLSSRLVLVLIKRIAEEIKTGVFDASIDKLRRVSIKANARAQRRGDLLIMMHSI